MPATVDATSHATATASGATSITWNHTCGASANKLLIQFTAGSSSATERTANSVTYNSVAATRVDFADDGAFERSEIWQLNSPETGSALSVVVNFGAGTPIQVSGGAISFNGAAAALGTASKNNGTSANPSVTVVDSASGDIVVSVIANDNSTGATTEGGTLIWEDENVGSDSDFSAQYQTATGANTVCSWTNSGNVDGWAALGVAVKSASGSYTLTAAQGSYSLTGQAANLLVSKLLVADQGSYALTGQAANLSYSAAGRTLIADTGLYTLIGSDALVDLGMNAEFGTYNLTGQDAILTYAPLNSYTLVAASGTYNLNGQDANLLMGRVLPCVSGQYNLTGFASGLTWSGAAASGAYHGKIHMGLSDFRL